MIELILYIFACLKIDLFFTFNLNTMQKFLFVVALTLLYLTNCEVIRAAGDAGPTRTRYTFEKDGNLFVQIIRISVNWIMMTAVGSR